MDGSVRVRYRSDAGEAVETSLDRVEVRNVATGLPVREFRWVKGQRHYSGVYWCATTGGPVVYESRLEMARIMLADFSPDVVGIAAQPMQLVGSDGSRTRRHVPDLLLMHMSANSAPRPLPVRLRPLTAETGESYIHRLARANHLRPSHLRRYLATPAGSYGPIEASKLAVLSGRTLPALLRALPDLTPRPRRHGAIREADSEKQRNQAKKRARFIAIRRDARAGMSERAITRKHKVSKRTVNKALTSPTPPPRKKINRPSVALNGLHHHIDAMLSSNPEIQSAEVWRQLVDLHGTTASYHTVNDYVSNRRNNRLGSP